MGKKRNVYLGVRVKDIPPKGLTSLKEVESIANAIVNDYKKHRISLRTAQSRLNLLLLISKKQARKKNVRFKYRTAKQRIEKIRIKIKGKG